MQEWSCPKCNCKQYEKDQIQTAGGNFSKVFNVQNKRYVAISCKNCGYTEFYKKTTSAAMNVFDFFMNN